MSLSSTGVYSFAFRVRRWPSTLEPLAWPHRLKYPCCARDIGVDLVDTADMSTRRRPSSESEASLRE